MMVALIVPVATVDIILLVQYSITQNPMLTKYRGSYITEL